MLKWFCLIYSDGSYDYFAISIIFLIVFPDASHGLQVEFRRVTENGGSAVVNDVDVNADSTDTFQVVCRINNIGDLFKFTTIRVFRVQSNANTTLAQMQNIDETATDTYRKPVLGNGVSGWTAVGEYTTNVRDSYVGVAKQMSAMSCNDAVIYRCEVPYTTPGPAFASQTGVKDKTLSVQGNNCSPSKSKI